MDSYRHGTYHADEEASPTDMPAYAWPEKAFPEAVQLLSEFGSVPQWMRMTKKEVAGILDDSLVDFIYIDDRHDYCAVREDLELYWPVLKAGGIMAGHDFLTAEEARHALRGKSIQYDWALCADGRRNEGGVKQAVMDFVVSKGQEVGPGEIFVTSEYHPWRSWGFWKQQQQFTKKVCVCVCICSEK